MRPEELTDSVAIDLVLSLLTVRGWAASKAAHHQEGYDIVAAKGERSLRVEVKARSIDGNSGHRSGTPELRLRQQADGYRVHTLSRSQVRDADVVVAVWVGEEGTTPHYLVLPRPVWHQFQTGGASSRPDGSLTLGLRFDVATGLNRSDRVKIARSTYAPFLDEAGWANLEG